MKKAIFIIVIFGVGILCLSIALVTAKTELAITKSKLTQVSVKAEFWQVAFRSLYNNIKTDLPAVWSIIQPYGRLALVEAHSELTSRDPSRGPDECVVVMQVRSEAESFFEK